MGFQAYKTHKGYWIKILHGGYGAENSWRPQTNDFDIEPIIDVAMKEVCCHGWTDKETAQQVLDKLAVTHNWPKVETWKPRHQGEGRVS